MTDTDRSIEAIARRVYELMWDVGGGYSSVSDTFSKRFQSALAAEMQPVRRVRDSSNAEWFEWNGMFYPEQGRHLRFCPRDRKELEESYGPLTELPPAYVGLARGDVKTIAAELWAAWSGWSAAGYPSDESRESTRQRFEAAIARLMQPPAAEPVEIDAPKCYTTMLAELREGLLRDSQERAKANDYTGAVNALKASEAVWKLEQMDGVKFFVPF